MIWCLLSLQLLLLLKWYFFLLEEIWRTHWHDIFLQSRCWRWWLRSTSSIDHSIRAHLKLACSCCISYCTWIAWSLSLSELRRSLYYPRLSRYQSIICHSILLLYLFGCPCCSSLFIVPFLIHLIILIILICLLIRLLFHYAIEIFARYPSFWENDVRSAWRSIVKLRLQLIAWSKLLIRCKWLETSRESSSCIYLRGGSQKLTPRGSNRTTTTTWGL